MRNDPYWDPGWRVFMRGDLMHVFALRLVLDGLAVVLLIAALAYWGFGNLAHEAMGAGLFALIVLHVWCNRRWFSGLFRGPHDLRRGMVMAVHLAFLAVMVVVLGTSLVLARDLFSIPGIDAGVRLREVHLFAAYWAVALLGVHLGLNWRIVMGFVRARLGLRGRAPLRVWCLRVLSALIAAQGILASGEMGLGAKLSLNLTLDMWDFTSQTPRFFLNYGAIIGLYTAVGHYGEIVVQSLQRRAALPPTR